MKTIKPTTIATFIVLLFGFTLFFIGSDGFTAFTAEKARVTKLVEEKPEFPLLTMEDSEGRTYTMEEFKDKYVFITFIYTGCTTVCIQIEQNMAQVYEQIPKEYLGKEIVFLSISFDPTRDDPATLDKYKNLFNSDGETWRMVRISEQKKLDDLLNKFGVIVIPDGNGNFAHNAAFYLVDGSGTLVDVLDYREIDAAGAYLNQLLKKGKGE